MRKTIVLCALLLGNAFASENIQQFLAGSQEKMKIICFYTSWCPACRNSIDTLNEVHTKFGDKVEILGVNLDDGVKRKVFVEPSSVKFKTVRSALAQVQIYGVKDSVPVIIVLNDQQAVIKRFYETPNRAYFLKLIGRLSSGYLENGTLPIEKRVDLWKNKRE